MSVEPTEADNECAWRVLKCCDEYDVRHGAAIVAVHRERAVLAERERMLKLWDAHFVGALDDDGLERLLAAVEGE